MIRTAFRGQVGYIQDIGYILSSVVILVKGVFRRFRLNLNVFKLMSASRARAKNLGHFTGEQLAYDVIYKLQWKRGNRPPPPHADAYAS